MPMRPRRWSLALALFSALAIGTACGNEAGLLQLVVTWDDAGPPPENSFVFFRVVRAEGRQEGDRVADDPRIATAAGFEVDPVRFSEAQTIRVPDVPDGDAYAAVVEVRENPSRSSTLLRLGISAVFALRANQTTMVEVPIVGVPPPAADGASTLLIGTGTTSASIVRESVVPVRIRTDTGVRALLSNLETLPSANTRIVAIDRSRCPGGVCETLVEDYDLNDGLEDRCVEQDNCARRVFVQLEDARSARSLLVSRDVVLDTKAPGVAAGFAAYIPLENPLGQVAAAAAGSQVVVTTSFSEPLDLEAPLRMFAVGNGQRAELRLQGQAAPTSATFALTVTAALPDGDYTPEVEMTDRAGNTATVLAADQAQLLGTARPEPSGAWSRKDLELVNFDTPRVYVTGFDGAGNETAPVLIRNSWLVGSSAPPPTGQSPHRARLSGTVDPPLMNRGREGSVAESGSPDGLAALQAAERVWKQHRGEAPPARQNHAMVYDSARGRVVLFGGFANGTRLADTWEWDGAQWRDVTPSAVSPPARDQHEMVYDSARGRAVLFGGTGGGTGGALNDTWEWNGTRWTEVTPSGPRPQGRIFHAMAFDSVRRRTVLFGGRLETEVDVQDTWEWDGTGWINVVPAGARPPGRAGHKMAFDPGRSRVVMFDGLGIGDLWEWDGTRWEAQNPSGDEPQGRFGHGMVFDPASGGVLVFGGFSETDELLSDLWSWDGTAWTELVPVGASPPGQFLIGAALDSQRGRLVVFGGLDAGEEALLSTTWEWDGTRWTSATPAVAMRWSSIAAAGASFSSGTPGPASTTPTFGSGTAPPGPTSPPAPALHRREAATPWRTTANETAPSCLAAPGGRYSEILGSWRRPSPRLRVSSSRYRATSRRTKCRGFGYGLSAEGGTKRRMDPPPKAPSSVPG